LFCSGRICDFELGEELLTKTCTAKGHLFNAFPNPVTDEYPFPVGLNSVKVLDYHGPPVKGIRFTNHEGHYHVLVHAYKMCKQLLGGCCTEPTLFGDVKQLPSLELEGIWERYTFISSLFVDVYLL
jgi:hypothetical protein